jgi:hypothetical protein
MTTCLDRILNTSPDFTPYKKFGMCTCPACSDALVNGTNFNVEQESIFHETTNANISEAVVYNRANAVRLGWDQHLYDIVEKVFRVDYSPEESHFAELVAEWQATQGLTADGKLGPKTWAAMKPLLGLSSHVDNTQTPASGNNVPGLNSSCPDSPGKWAKSYFKSKLWPWWNDRNLQRNKPPEDIPVGSTIRSMLPHVFPGVPPEVILGFCANGSFRENTTKALLSQKFHEIGLFGIEAGPRNGPAPNPNPKAKDNSWGHLHDHPLVVKLLHGRPATMVHNAWKNAVEDQVAVGLVNLEKHGKSVVSALASSIRPNTSGPMLSNFFIACCFMGWSAGPPQAARHINRFATTLARYPESERWGIFLKTLAEQIRSGSINLNGLIDHNSPAHSALRTWQKIAAGQLLAFHTNGQIGWFDTKLGVDEQWVAEVITCAALKAKKD